MEYLNFIFSGFWTFVGCLIIVTAILNFISKCWIAFWRHLSIRKHGYPPSHCDADGDLIKLED
jgi:hypothetical protein